MNLQKIVIIGAGTMGSGIAQWFAQQMCSVELVDNSEEQLKKALAGIHASWDKLVEKEKLTSCQVNQMKKLFEIKTLDQVSKNTDLVIEAIIENLDSLKSKKIFSRNSMLVFCLIPSLPQTPQASLFQKWHKLSHQSENLVSSVCTFLIQQQL
jgi:glycerol-3-phosphate dehydrogenase